MPVTPFTPAEPRAANIREAVGRREMQVGFLVPEPVEALRQAQSERAV